MMPLEPEPDDRYYAKEFGDRGESAGQWCLLVLRAKSHWCDFWLFEICGYESTVEGNMVLQVKGSPSSPDPLYPPSEDDYEWMIANAETLAEGHFKWDSCCEIGLDVHTCSADQWHSLFEIIARLPDIASEKLGVPRPEEWEWFQTLST